MWIWGNLDFDAKRNNAPKIYKGGRDRKCIDELYEINLYVGEPVVMIESIATGKKIKVPKEYWQDYSRISGIVEKSKLVLKKLKDTGTIFKEEKKNNKNTKNLMFFDWLYLAFQIIITVGVIFFLAYGISVMMGKRPRYLEFFGSKKATATIEQANNDKSSNLGTSELATTKKD